MGNRRLPWVARAMLLCAMTGVAAADVEKPLVIQPPVVELAVVQTRDELLKGQPVSVNGVELRLGIERATCSASSGILVYCISEKDPADFSDGAVTIWGESLGPLSVQVVGKGKIDQVREARKLVQMARQLHEGPVMFTAAARPPGDGPSEINVIGPDGTLLAKRTINVVKGEDAGWHRLAKSDQADAYTMSGGSVVPHWDGAVPHSDVKTLPHFLPEKEDPSLDVSVDKGVVRIKSTQQISHEIDENWAVRWFVNGKLAQPLLAEKQMHEDARKLRENSKLPLEFSFRLELDPAVLKTKPGDVVEFQLLYSSGEFQAADVRMAMKMMHAFNDHPGVRMSKRIAWNP